MFTQQLDAAAGSRLDWKPSPNDLQTGTEYLAKNKPKLDPADLRYEWIDLAKARAEGIMPIPYSAIP